MAKTTTLAILGKGNIAVSALTFAVHTIAAAKLPISVVGCANADDHGIDTWQPSLKKRANNLGVPIVSLAQLEPLSQMVLISLEFDKIIKTKRFASAHLYNIHFSKLPAYRGVYCSIWPILNGEVEAGVTLHRIDDGIDTGAIIEQRTFPLSSHCTARHLYDSLNDEGLELFKSSFSNLLYNDIRSVAQDELHASYYSRRSIDFHNIVIDVTQDARAIERFVRAFHFPEYQLPKLGARAVWECHILPNTSLLPAGTCLYESQHGCVVVVGDGHLMEFRWI